jgi:ABC-2 type transport system ATP-binding protein
MSPPLLTAVGLTRAVGRGARRVRAVDDVSLDLLAGEIAVLAGASGAGKTTLLRLLAGQLRADAGFATVLGRPVGGCAARRFLGFAPDAPAFPPALTVRELLDYVARLHEPGPRRRDEVTRAIDFAGLEGAAHRRAAALSPTHRSRLALAQAVIGQRRVVLLDETFGGLDPPARDALGASLREYARGGAAVLIASRQPGVLEGVATRGLLLEGGRLVAIAALGAILDRRVLEIVLDRPPAAPPPGFRITASGIETELRGTTTEAALALCRAYRLPVRATRVRSGALDDRLAWLAEPGPR